jgi:hypothetical protein
MDKTRVIQAKENSKITIKGASAGDKYPSVKVESKKMPAITILLIRGCPSTGKSHAVNK